MSEATIFNCVRFIIVRNGSAILPGDFDQQPISVGNIACRWLLHDLAEMAHLRTA